MLGAVHPGRDVSRVGSDVLVPEIAWCLAHGRLHAYRLELRAPDLLVAERATAMAASDDVRPTWIELVVVWADTGEPVAGVELEITLPGRRAEPKKTDGGGRIRYDGIRGGNCRLFGTFKGLHVDQCVECVGFGEVERSAPARPGSRALPPPHAIVTLRQRRVRSNDTLDAIAKRIGMTWQDLARFNWGTSDPEAVNEHLRDDVGCWKKTADGKSYVFSDFDDPGVIVLPGEWSTEALPTGETHVVQVRRLPPAPRFLSWSV